MEGAGHAPMSSVRRSFSSVMLCMATSVFVSSTGSSNEKRVFGLTFPPPSDTLLSSSLTFACSSEDFNTRLPGGIWLGSFSLPMICLWISSPNVGDLTSPWLCDKIALVRSAAYATGSVILIPTLRSNAVALFLFPAMILLSFARRPIQSAKPSLPYMVLISYALLPSTLPFGLTPIKSGAAFSRAVSTVRPGMTEMRSPSTIIIAGSFSISGRSRMISSPIPWAE